MPLWVIHSLWRNAVVMTGAGVAILDHEVEAMSEDGKAKQEREPGFLHHRALYVFWMANIWTVCERELHFYWSLLQYSVSFCLLWGTQGLACSSWKSLLASPRPRVSQPWHY